MSQLTPVTIPAGQALTITANATSAGSYWLIGNPGDAPGAPVVLAAGASVVVGPFQTPQNYMLQSNNGVMTTALAVVGAYNQSADQANEAAIYAPIASPTFTGVPVLPVGFKIGTVVTTSTGTELNYVHGVTSAVQTQITNEASTRASADTNNANAITSEASARSNADSTLQSNIDAKAPLASPIFTTTPLRTTVNNGTAGAGCTAVEYGDGFGQNTVITINHVLPAITGGVAQGLGIPIYTFPAGSIMMLSNAQNVALTQTEGHITADTPSVALGTTIASGAVSDLTGTAGFFNFTDTPQTAADCNGTQAYNVCVVGNKLFRTDSHTLYVNYAANWAASGDTAAVVTGTVHINWNFLGA